MANCPDRSIHPPIGASAQTGSRRLPSLLAFVIALSLLVGLGVSLVRGDDAAPPEKGVPKGDSESTAGTAPLKDEITPELRKSIKRGLDWLSKNQGEDGDYGDPGITGLAGLAFMADGNMPGEGTYGKNVDRALDYVVKNVQESGMASNEMYGHGFATLFMAEAYGTTQRPDVKEKLQLAVRLIVQTQNKQGGWRYQPVPNDADISVTICEVMALRAARNAGIKVPKRTIDNAIDYVKKSQCPDGGFMYTLGGGGSAFPRSAAGCAIMYYSGIYSGNELNAGIKYLSHHIPGTGENLASGHTFYGNYYGTQAMFLAGGDSWAKWWPAVRKQVMSLQQANGSWNGEASEQYATAMALIILQVPNRLLPILQK